ncbi:hypothetical protein BVC71_07270 [Marivivens niveibacter]|uniref:DUF262 domain-containing protein n=1 Tax=Marivivens niveibacter TaxID=1930667 RepID=A0A251WZ96_9RHOB|nr:DUF262 domain-containing protein [Marivivens niveibacter]OUD09631.1 hypothetical protein BVC71_07270 [Marivivens niveibacter]
MDSALKVTDQADEIAFSAMVGGDNIINIPLFQRAYRWKPSNIGEFWDDIDSILDETSRSHFLGVLVLVPQNRKVGHPVVLDVVDGQQRLSTCYITLMAMAYAAAESGHIDWATEVIQSFLLTRKFLTYSTNTRLIPSAADRQQFHNLWAKLRSLTPFSANHFGGVEALTPQPSGEPKGRMQKAFEISLKRCRQIIKDQGFSKIEEVFEVVTGKMSFVTINLRSPTAAPAIFERLNARGEKINISDLVRNEVFSRVGDDAARAKQIFESHWEPFVNLFGERDGSFENFLFPYGLTIKSNITKADLFTVLREHWQAKDGPMEIVQAMNAFVGPYLVLETGKTTLTIDPEVSRAYAKLNRLNVPSTTYSFLLRLAKSVSDGLVSSKTATEIVDVIESFLFRRAVCGIEPSGLHAVFKTLWAECEKSADGVSAISVIKSISRRSTVPWPNDIEFEQAIRVDDLYSRKVCRFALQEFEKFTQGETPKDDFHIEHIYPQKPGKDWTDSQKEELAPLVNCWANLIPLTVQMNPSLGNASYIKKSAQFANSIFASPRKIAKQFDDWNITNITKRADEIAAFAKQRWPHVRVTS